MQFTGTYIQPSAHTEEEINKMSRSALKARMNLIKIKKVKGIVVAGEDGVKQHLTGFEALKAMNYIFYAQA